MSGTEENTKLVESQTRLSESTLWALQKKFFSSAQIDAWKKEIPCYISSNAFTGTKYAHLVHHYIEETLQKHPEYQNIPFTILELGAGTGKFSFHFLKALADCNPSYKIRYVVSDVVKANVEFCQQLENLAPYIEKGWVDFAEFDVESDTDFTLLREKKFYSALAEKTPLIIIANYTFDCITQDTFTYDNHALQESRVTITSRYADFDSESARHLSDLRLSFTQHPINNLENYYEEAWQNDLLKVYQDCCEKEDTIVMMPLGALKFLKNLKALTNNHYCLIAGDKGVAKKEKFKFFTPNYRVTFDGCFSFTVNFDAMGAFCLANGGDYLPSESGNNFKVNMMMGGGSFKDYPGTVAYFHDKIDRVGPDEYCSIYDEFANSSYRFALKSLLSFLKFSQYDPYAYAAIHDRLLECYHQAQPQVADDILKALEKVEENLFYADIDTDVFRLLGVFYQDIKKDDKALALYEKSLAVYGDKEMPHFNMALIYDERKDKEKAIEHYQKAISKKRKPNQYAVRRLAILQGKPSLALLKPFIRATFVVGLLLGGIYLLLR